MVGAVAVLSATTLRSEMKDVNVIPVHSYQITSSNAPNGGWKFMLKDSGDEDLGPTMWLVGVSNRKKIQIGHLQRDAELVWCPTGQCLFILEQPSIETVRLALYRLDAEARRVTGIDSAIRNAVQSSIGQESRMLFYNVRPLKWRDDAHLVIAVQTRYVKKGTNGPAELFTEGYVLNVVDGRIAGRLSAGELQSKYGFAGRIADLIHRKINNSLCYRSANSQPTVAAHALASNCRWWYSPSPSHSVAVLV
jgi:hypothetical protein